MDQIERLKKQFSQLWQSYKSERRYYQKALTYEPPPSDYVPGPDDPLDEELWMSKKEVLEKATHDLRQAQAMLRMNLDAQRRFTNRPRRRY